MSIRQGAISLAKIQRAIPPIASAHSAPYTEPSFEMEHIYRIGHRWPGHFTDEYTTVIRYDKLLLGLEYVLSVGKQRELSSSSIYVCICIIAPIDAQHSVGPMHVSTILEQMPSP